MRLFSWRDIEEPGDQERLRPVLDYMPDEELIISWKKSEAVAETIIRFEPCGMRFSQESSSSMNLMNNSAANWTPIKRKKSLS